MALTNTTVAETYQGNGVTTDFAIPFEYFFDSQVYVRKISQVDGSEVELVQGEDFIVNAPNVELSSAPAANEAILVYRQTELKQIVDYIDSGAFQSEDHEKGMDLIVMMIQELDYSLDNLQISGAVTKLGTQTVGDGDTISVDSTEQELFKKLVASAAQADNVLIEDGGIDQQRLRLMGTSNTLPVQIIEAANISLGGAPVVLYLNTVLDLLWIDEDSNWVKTN